MLDLLVLWIVWISSLAILCAALFRMNHLPKGGGLLIHIKRLLLLVLFSGALCIAISPFYGWGWSAYGGHLIAVSIGLFVMVQAAIRYTGAISAHFDQIFDVLE